VTKPVDQAPAVPALGLPDDQLAAAVRTVDWDFANADTSHSGHALQPYPAKFPPQIPEALIRLLSRADDLVLDCFGGCGTTALEAVRLGRRAHSIDANPVAARLTEIKTSNLGSPALRSLNALIATVSGVGVTELVRQGAGCWRPAIPNIDRWYAPLVVDELAALRCSMVRQAGDEQARTLGLIAFAQVASRMSFQESETRYKSVPRLIEAGEAAQRLASELVRMRAALIARADLTGSATVITGDARDPAAYPEPDSVGLIITSPPYPNAYDYHLYHRFRIFWLGGNPADLRHLEIGSHLNNQSTEDPVFRYERDMARTLANAHRVLQPGRFAAFVVGDGIHNAQVYETSAAISRLGALVGLEPVLSIDRQLPSLRRSVTVAGRRLRAESIVILRKPPASASAALPPPYELFPYEEELARREVEVLCTAGPAAPLQTPRQAAFWYALPHAGARVPTWQAAAEYAPGASARKNSAYAGHGLHRYKGKFYPQLAKALINLSNPYTRAGIVLDPFGGCGTVALEARLAGLRAVSMDVNPLAIEVTRAKLALLDLSVPCLEAAISRVSSASATGPGEVDWAQFSPQVHAELESWFPRTVLAKLGLLLSAIDQAASRSASRQLLSSVLRAVVSDMIREVSQQEPSDLRIRRRSPAIADAPVFELFADRARRTLEKRRQIQHRLDLGPELGTATAIEADAAEQAPYQRAVDPLGHIATVVSSPPYGVALPYLDTDRLSLAAVYGIDKTARKDLERKLIGSREITGRDQAEWEMLLRQEAALGLPARTVSFLESLQRAVAADKNAGFRRQQLPAVLLRYFSAMSRVLSHIGERLAPGADVTLVLGDSATTIDGVRWTIPTVDEVLAIAKERGLALVDGIPITVTREALLNSRHSITENRIIRLAP
jgi:DNA modification methylase